MARIKGATMTHKRRKKMLKLAKGFYGCKSKHFKMAKQQVMKSGNYALAGRRMKKRQFRNLWICRINNCLLYTSPLCAGHGGSPRPEGHEKASGRRPQGGDQDPLGRSCRFV